jgi:uncharacterized protein YyaL (SSP411 family)
MDAETYSKPAVAKLINEKFIALKVDQDSRPDLSNRYREYGWPATIILNGSGLDLAKRAGFIEPDEMISMLREAVQNPNKPVASAAVSVTSAAPSRLTEPVRTELEKRYRNSTDREIGGLKISQRYLEADTVERAIELAARGAKDDREIALPTLRSNLKLVDPVWGGVYQYSTHSGWDKPHFEKIMPAQANNLRLYSLAARVFNDPDFENTALSISGYLNNFLLAPAGAFYTSQDADVIKGQHSAEYFSLPDRKRRIVGVPAIDTNIYSRENGLAIEALAAHFGFTGEERALKSASGAAEWIAAHRQLPGGGFRHGEKDAAGPYLGDSLTMSRAFLMLYTVTAERRWLERAASSASFFVNNFTERENGVIVPGFITGKSPPGSPLKPVRQLDENIMAVRHLNLLSHYTGRSEFRAAAEGGMKYLGAEGIALDRLTEAGILSADDELGADPLHITVVGSRQDSTTKELFTAALRYPTLYRRIELWDRAEGPMPNPDVQYPELPRTAAFVCTNKRCSLPLFDRESLLKTIDTFQKQDTQKRLDSSQ